MLAALRPTIDRRRATVRVVGRLPEVIGDAGLIGTALSNLISNGLKFNHRVQPRVEIGCLPARPPAGHPRCPADGMATFYVRDNGIGIDPKDHEAIFTIFRRLPSRREYEGSGAGLTIVRKIVQSHGGRIWVESRPGAGSTFFFTLAPADAKAAAGPPAKPPHWAKRVSGNPTQPTPLLPCNPGLPATPTTAPRLLKP